MLRVLALCIMIMLSGPLFSQSTFPASPSNLTAEKSTPLFRSNGETPPRAAEAESGSYSLAYYFKLGGIFMYPLLILAAAGLALITERILYTLRHTSGGEAFAEGLLRSLNENKDPQGWCQRYPKLAMAQIFDKALAHQRTNKRSEADFLREVETLAAIDIAARERNLALIASIANLAPLVGFLGTITGMIGAFGSIAQADQVSARIVSSGIFEALITTAAGLLIAIPTSAFHNYAIHRIDRLAATIEKTAAELASSLPWREPQP